LRISACLMCVICVISQPLWGQTPEYLTNLIPSPYYKYHPEGRVGQIAINGYFEYASNSTDDDRYILDAKKLAGGLDFIPTGRLTLKTRFMLTKQDSTVYEISGGFKFYLKNPLSPLNTVNPDGPIGGTVISTLIGARYTYRYYEKIQPRDVKQVYGNINIYFADYIAGAFYENPDGPAGNPVVKLTGGGSEKGVFGESAILFPIKPTTTLKLVFRFARADDPSRRSLVAGVGFAYYLSN